jgi:pilus assembly protein Flp/PilA
MMNALRNFWMDEEGASGVEYALLVALIGIAFIAGAGALGTAIQNRLNSAAGTVTSGSAG